MDKTTMKKEKIFKQAVETWGKETQIDLLLEECSELIHALCKRKRYLPIEELYGLRSNVIEEMVDVQIMIEQLHQEVLTEEGREEFAETYNEKLNKVKWYLEMKYK